MSVTVSDPHADEDCKCVFCPLDKANVQLSHCPIEYFPKDKAYGINMKQLAPYEQYKHELLYIAMWTLKKEKIRIGESLTMGNPVSTWTIHHIARNKYKMCYHANCVRG